MAMKQIEQIMGVTASNRTESNRIEAMVRVSLLAGSIDRSIDRAASGALSFLRSLPEILCAMEGRRKTILYFPSFYLFSYLFVCLFVYLFIYLLFELAMAVALFLQITKMAQNLPTSRSGFEPKISLFIFLLIQALRFHQLSLFLMNCDYCCLYISGMMMIARANRSSIR
jgi:hypothetical protein